MRQEHFCFRRGTLWRKGFPEILHSLSQGASIRHAAQPRQYPILGTLMMLCIGNVYAWSVFRKPLEKAYGWTAAEATMPFQISIAFFALAMIFAGRWQDRSGPRPVAVTGGILIGLGFILSGLFGSTLAGICIAFGVIAGIGMGGAYVTPLATTIRWWADKRGLMTGVVVMGMGAGSIIGGIGGPILIDKVGMILAVLMKAPPLEGPGRSEAG